MTLQEFQQSIREGIPAELPAPKPYDPEVNHAPKRKDILTKRGKKNSLSGTPYAISNRGIMLFWPVNLQKN